MYDQKLYTPAMSQKNGAVVGAEVVKRKGCFSANPDDHVAFLQKYGDLGFTISISTMRGQIRRACWNGMGARCCHGWASSDTAPMGRDASLLCADLGQAGRGWPRLAEVG